MAQALARIGWSDAGLWMRLQAAYDWPRSGAGKRPEHMTTDDLRDELASLFEAAANVGLHVFASYIA